MDNQAARTFSEDVAFLSKYQDVHVLKSPDGQAQVALVAAFQGRVMTSTAGGDDGESYGWINYAHIAAGELVPHINVYGGEDRFWIGPEGGQYAVFFKPGDPFDLEHWQTPALIDSMRYDIRASSDRGITFAREASLQNCSGAMFDVGVERKVSLLDGASIRQALSLGSLDDMRAVAYESVNTLKNAGERAWEKETGLLSIWILGMYKPGEKTTIVVPFEPGGRERGPKIVDDYFGKVPPDRLVVADDVAFFSGDGRCRGKIGVPPKRAKPIVGSYDPVNGVLTLVQYTLPEGRNEYVNSLWEWQDAPYAGDVVNSYNDGPPEPGVKPLGPFYELETSSPALALGPGEHATHVHRTFHFQGEASALDTIARQALGVSIEDIENKERGS